MCLLVVALEASARYPLVIAANRDEQHARPTEAAAWWGSAAPLLAGRDVRAGGTWLAVDRRGRFAAVTNIREPLRLEAPRSRGALVTSYVASEESAAAFAARAAREDGFGPFNLLLFDGREMHYASNRAAAARLDAGVHAFSNAPRGIDWPKVESARALAEPLLAHDAPLEPLFDLLGERDPQSPPEERYRRAHFLVGPAYGTRCSTVVLVDAAGAATFVERTFDATGRLVGEVRERFALDGER